MNLKPLNMKPPDPFYWSKLRAQSLKKNPLKRTGKIRKVSKKLSKMKTIYGHLRNAFMERNPFCEARLPECTIEAVDCHHRAGREGEKLIDETNFLAVCRSCHSLIHDKLSATEAREKGLRV